MSTVPINVFALEDLDKDFVWAVRKPEFKDVARPTVDQIEPVVITTETFALVIVGADGKLLRTYPMTVSDPAQGRINANVQSNEWRALMKHEELFYRVMRIKGTSDRALFGGPFSIEKN